jgi:hypothetical protein
MLGWLFILPLDCSKDQATYPPLETGRFNRGRFGLAPDGVYPAPDVTTRTVSSYLAFSPLLRTTVSPNAQSGLFSVTLSSDRSESPLATILPFGVRTFLPFSLLTGRRSNHLAYSSLYFYTVLFELFVKIAPRCIDLSGCL